MPETNSSLPQAMPNASGPVLVAVDFSPDSEAALAWSCRYANLTGARLIVLHVVHDPGEAPGYYRRSEDDTLRPMEDVAEEMLENFLKEAQSSQSDVAASGNLETKLVRGIPASRILETAAVEKASLIVMGSRGRTGLPNLLLGSKSQRVAQMASMPVTIVKAANAEDEPE